MRFLNSIFANLTGRCMEARTEFVTGQEVDGGHLNPGFIFEKPLKMLQSFRRIFRFPLRTKSKRMKAKVEDCDPKSYLENSKDKTKYSLIRRIGTGSVSTCYESIRAGGKGSLLVLKVVENSSSSSSHQQILNEISHLRRIERHSNVVKFLDDFTDPSGRVCLVIEYCEHGSLADYMENGGRMGQHLIANISRQILKGLQHVHRQNLVHRDLKLGNILLNSEYIVKITDFGLASPVLECQGSSAKLCGTPNYLAPEVCQRKGYSFASDVWSFGVCLYTLCTGQVPFHVPADGPNVLPDEVISQTMSKIVSGRFSITNSIDSVGARITLASVLVINPAKRPTVEQLLDADYLSCSCNPLNCNDNESCRQKYRRRSLTNNKLVGVITSRICQSLLTFQGEVPDLIWMKCWGQVTADTLHYVLSNNKQGVLQRGASGTYHLHRHEDSIIFHDLLAYTQQLELDLRNFYPPTPVTSPNHENTNVCAWHYCADGSIGFLFDSGGWQVNFGDHVKLLVYRNSVIIISGHKGSHENLFNWLQDDCNRKYLRPLCEIVQMFSAGLANGR